MSTSEKPGKRVNISEKTIRRNAEFASGLEKPDPALKSDILSGKTKVNKALIQQIGKTDVSTLPLTTPEQIEEAAKEPLKVKKAISTGLSETPKETLIRQLTELTRQLQLTGRISLCDEIILCASKIKKIPR